MNHKISVLGAGLVGSVITRELSNTDGLSVTVFDRSTAALDAVSRTTSAAAKQCDLSERKQVEAAIAGADLVVSAVPGWLGYAVCETVLTVGKPLVDIAFFPEDPTPLAKLAERAGVPAILDIGVAPGLSNMLTAQAAASFTSVDSVKICVGGLPRIRSWPYEYKAVFSPADVIEEYTRPSRIVRGSEIRTVPALSEPEFIEIQGLGTLEAFVTDGLRSLLHTISAKEMVEKTLRYPGHRALMEVFREGGFFSTEKLDIEGAQLSPRQFTSKLMFDSWKMAPGEEDLTVLLVEIAGDLNHSQKTVRYEMLDRYDPSTRTTSMARTTGYTAVEMTRLVAEGAVSAKGLLFPEQLGPSVAKQLFARLAERGIKISESWG